MTVKRYLLSFPERVTRAALGLGAGVAREVGEVAIPASVRRGQLYQNLVDTTLRFLTEQVGGAQRDPGRLTPLPGDFLARRTAGNAFEVLGIVAFRTSPVWVLAALADVCGIGRHLIPEIADELKRRDCSSRRRPSAASTNCSTGSSGHRPGWLRRSTRRRSTSPACAGSGVRFATRRRACSRRACRPRRRSAACGARSRRSRGRSSDRSSRRRR